MIAEPRQEYTYNSEAFEAYAKKEGLDEKAKTSDKVMARETKTVLAR